MIRAARSVLLTAAVSVATAPPALAAPDLWPDYRLVGTEQITAFQPGSLEIRRVETGAEVPGSRQALRRNERDVPMRVSAPTEAKSETFEVKDAPSYSTRIQGRLQLTMSHTKVTINRLDWTETPYVDYTVHKWEAWDAFKRQNTYGRKRVATWTDPVSGRSMSYAGPETLYGQVDDDRTWPPVPREDQPVEVGRGILKTGKVGPTIVGTRIDVAEASRRSLASVGASGAGQMARGAYGFRGDQGSSISQARSASGQAVAASLGSRATKASASARGVAPASGQAVAIGAAKVQVAAAAVTPAVLGSARPPGLGRPPGYSVPALNAWVSGVQGNQPKVAQWRELARLAIGVSDTTTRSELIQALEDNVNTAKDLREAAEAIGRISNAAARAKAQAALEQIRAGLLP
jgi:hypothetical protein